MHQFTSRARRVLRPLDFVIGVRLQRHSVVAALVALTVAWAAPVENDKFKFIDIQPKANVKLTDDFHADNPGNNLAELKAGEHKLADVQFKIGEKCIQLGSPLLQQSGRDFPAAVEGIEVNSEFSKLHFVHALGFGIAYEAQPETLPKDKVIAKFTVIYEDGTKEAIPIVYGEDACDWWYVADSQYHNRVPTRAKIAWEGANDVTKALAEQANVKAVVRLYLTSWKNPMPGKKVKSLEFRTAASDLPSAPFCVAITAEKE